jgi:hypothetical protein
MEEFFKKMKCPSSSDQSHVSMLPDVTDILSSLQNFVDVFGLMILPNDSPLIILVSLILLSVLPCHSYVQPV